MEISHFELYPFSRSNISKWSRGGHLSIVVGIKIVISLWKDKFYLKRVALSYSFQYSLFPNSQYDKMNSYSRIQQPSTSFSVANISRMASGMPCINKYSQSAYWLVINVYITHNTDNCRQFTSQQLVVKTFFYFWPPKFHSCDLIVIVCVPVDRVCHISQHMLYQLKASTNTIRLAHEWRKSNHTVRSYCQKDDPHTPKKHYCSSVEVSFYNRLYLLIPPLHTYKKCSSGQPSIYSVHK